MQPTHKTPREQFDENLEEEQKADREHAYRNKNFILFGICVACIILGTFLFSFVESLIYYDVMAIEVIAMLSAMFVQVMFWICILKEKCHYPFKVAIHNYWYQVAIWMVCVASMKLFESFCPAFFI